MKEPDQPIHIKLTTPTPKLNDPEMKERLQTYKGRDSEDAEKGQERLKLLRIDHYYKNKALMKEIEKIARENKRDMEKVNFEQLMQHIQHEEFKKTLDLMNKIEFGDSQLIKQLYIYALKDMLDHHKEANGVARNYHSGKFDPFMMNLMDKKKTKKGKVKRQQL